MTRQRLPNRRRKKTAPSALLPLQYRYSVTICNVSVRDMDDDQN